MGQTLRHIRSNSREAFSEITTYLLKRLTMPLCLSGNVRIILGISTNKQAVLTTPDGTVCRMSEQRCRKHGQHKRYKKRYKKRYIRQQKNNVQNQLRSLTSLAKMKSPTAARSVRMRVHCR